MAKNHKNITGFPSNKENPFKDIVIEHIDEGRKVMFANSKQADRIIDGKTGDLKGHAVFARQVKVDKARFTKIYISSLGALTNLSKTGIRVLKYVIESLKPNQDFIIFDLDSARESSGYKSQRSIFNGIAELLDAGIIARSKNHLVYYVNPTMIFNGNRLTLMADYMVDDKSSFDTVIDRKVLDIPDKDIF